METTLNYWDDDGGDTQILGKRLAGRFMAVKSPSLLDQEKKLATWSSASCALALACQPSLYKKKRKKEKCHQLVWLLMLCW